MTAFVSLHEAIAYVVNNLKTYRTYYGRNLKGSWIIAELADAPRFKVRRVYDTSASIYMRDKNNTTRRITDAEIAECLALAAGQTA